MKNINMNTRIIGKCGNMLMLSNDFKASLGSVEELAFVVEADTGKQLTELMPVDYLLRVEEDLEWEPVDDFYDNVYPERFKEDYALDGLMGAAVGDALGVPVEFLEKRNVRKINVQEMIGKDTGIRFRSRWGNLIPSGAWSDDTAMTYATMDSIVREKEINYDDIMMSYLDWWSNGKYSSLDFPFGLGRTVGEALDRFSKGTPALECGGKGVRDNGNGALMRILPFSLYCIENNLSEEETAKVISEGSAITHGHDISKMSCFIYTEFMRKIIETKNKEMAFNKILDIDYSKYFSDEAIAAHSKLLDEDFVDLPDEQINGSGYVVDSLECALYSVLNTDNYEDAIKNAINTGYDTDTIACIAGGLAGVLYGVENIPERWKNKLLKRDELELTAMKFDILIDLKKNDLMDMVNEYDIQDSDDISKLFEDQNTL